MLYEKIKPGKCHAHAQERHNIIFKYFWFNVGWTQSCKPSDKDS